MKDTRIQFEGTHISGRLERERFITIRNKDNICSATIAHNTKTWGARKAWRAFISEVSKETTFAEAVDFFEQRKIRMKVSG